MIVSKLFAISMAVLTAAAAAADADMDYEGEISIYTGEPITAEENAEEQIVSVSSGVTYNVEKNEFTMVHPQNSLITVTSNVPNKMVTTKSVSVSISDGANARLYRDGEEIDISEDYDLTAIEDVGSYAVVTQTGDSEYQLHSFTIIPDKTGAVSSYQLPDGFELTEVMIDDEPVNMTGNNVVNMKKEGQYLISYRCIASKVEYALRVDIDHTPPDLELDGVVDGKARGAVTVSGIGKSDSYTLTKDGEEIRLNNDGILKMPGRYEITVTDDADNAVTEEFEIQFYLNRQGLLFALIAIAVIASIIVYMVRARKKLRVR